MKIINYLLVITSVPLTVLSLCVNAEMCSRSIAGCVESSNCHIAVPLLHHQERRHIREVFN